MADDFIGFGITVDPPSASLEEQEAALVTQAEANAAKIEAAYNRIEAAGKSAASATNLEEVKAATAELQGGVEALSGAAEELASGLAKAREAESALGGETAETDKRIAALAEEMRRLTGALDQADTKLAKGASIIGLQRNANAAQLAIRNLEEQIAELAERGVGISPEQSERLAQLRERYDGLKDSIARATRATQEAKDEAARASVAFTEEKSEVEQLRDSVARLEATLNQASESIRRGDIGSIGRQAQSAEFQLEQLRVKVQESLASQKPVDPQVLSSLEHLETQVARNVKVAAAAKKAQDEYGDSLAAAQIRAGDFSGGVGGIVKAIDTAIPGFENLTVQLGFIALGVQVATQAFSRLREVGNFLAGELSGDAKGFDKLVTSVFQLNKVAEGFVAVAGGTREALNQTDAQAKILTNDYVSQGKVIRSIAQDYAILEDRLRQNFLALGRQADAIRELKGQFDQLDVSKLAEQIARVNTAILGIQRGVDLSQLEHQLPGITDELVHLEVQAKRVGEQLPQSFRNALNAVNQATRGFADGKNNIAAVQKAINDLAREGDAAGPRIGAAVRGNLEALRKSADALGSGTGSIAQVNHQLTELRDAARAVEGPLKEGTVKALDEAVRAAGAANRSFAELGVATVENLGIAIRAVKDYVAASGELLNAKQAQLVADKIAKIREEYELLPPAARAAANAQMKGLFEVEVAAGKAGAAVRDLNGNLRPDSFVAQVRQLQKSLEDLGGIGQLSKDQIVKAQQEVSRLLTEEGHFGAQTRAAAREGVEALASLRDSLGKVGAEFKDEFGRDIPASLRGSVAELLKFVAASGGLHASAAAAGEIRDRAEELLKAFAKQGPEARKSLQDQEAVLEKLVATYGRLSVEGQRAAEDLAKAARKQFEDVKKAYEGVLATLAKARAEFAKGFAQEKPVGPDPRDIAKQIEDLQSQTELTGQQIEELGNLQTAYKNAGGAAAASAAAQAEAAAKGQEQIAQLQSLNDQLQQSYAGQESALGARGEAINRVTANIISGLKDSAAQGKLTAAQVDEGLQSIQDAYSGTHAAGEAVREQLGIIAGEAAGIAPKLADAGKALPDYLKTLEDRTKQLEQAVRDVQQPAAEFGKAARDIEDGTKAAASAAQNLKDSANAASQSVEASVRGVDELSGSTEKLTEQIPELAKGLANLGEVSTGLGEKLTTLVVPLEKIGEAAGKDPDKLKAIADQVERIAKQREGVEALAKGLLDIQKAVAGFSDKDLDRIERLALALRHLRQDAVDAANAVHSVPL